MTIRHEPMLRAIQTFGGAAKLGEALGISGPAVSQWKQVPADRVIAVERLTGISRQELRPDLYPIEVA